MSNDRYWRKLQTAHLESDDPQHAQNKVVRRSSSTARQQPL